MINKLNLTHTHQMFMKPYNYSKWSSTPHFTIRHRSKIYHWIQRQNIYNITYHIIAVTRIKITILKLKTLVCCYSDTQNATFLNVGFCCWLSYHFTLFSRLKCFHFTLEFLIWHKLFWKHISNNIKTNNVVNNFYSKSCYQEENFILAWLYGLTNTTTRLPRVEVLTDLIRLNSPVDECISIKLLNDMFA